MTPNIPGVLTPNISTILTPSISTIAFENKHIDWSLELLHHISRSELVSEVLEILSGDNRRRGVNQGMQTDRLGLHKSFIDDDLDLVVGIVNLGEEGEMSLLHAEHGFEELVISES